MQLPANIAETAAALSCKFNGGTPALIRNGQELFPPLFYFTIERKDCVAHGATFTVKLPDLTPAALVTLCHETIATFAAAA